MTREIGWTLFFVLTVAGWRYNIPHEEAEGTETVEKFRMKRICSLARIWKGLT